MERETPAAWLRDTRPAVIPEPDPCLVSLKTSAGGQASDKAYRKARACPHGCGRVCKGIRAYRVPAVSDDAA